MRAAICSENEEEQKWMLELLQSCCAEWKIKVDFQLFRNRERYVMTHGNHPFDLSIIAFEGANGQEAAIHAKRLYHNGILIWMSSDRMFVLQGYRYGIEAFLSKPVSPQELTKTFRRCVKKYQQLADVAACAKKADEQSKHPD